MDSTVKYGDCVNIFCQQNQTREKIKQPIFGVVSTSSFVNESVYLEICEQQLFQQNSRKIGQIRNSRDFVFQIWPKLDYDAHKQLKLIQKQIDMVEKDIEKMQDDKLEQKLKVLKLKHLQELHEKQNEAQTRADFERQSNMRQLKNYINRPLCYGSEFFLMHYDSRYFLNGKVCASEQEVHSQKLTVTPFFSRGMIFQVLPKYKRRLEGEPNYYKEGEPVDYKDQLILFNIKLKCYMSASVKFTIEMDENWPQTPLTNYYPQLDYRRNVGRKRHQCCMSQIRSFTLQFQLHRSSQTFVTEGSSEEDSTNLSSNQGEINYEDNIIRAGDIIYIQHSELQGLLTADYSYYTGKCECYIRNYIGEYMEEKYSTNSLWEVETVNGQERGKDIQFSSQSKKTNQCLEECEQSPASSLIDDNNQETLSMKLKQDDKKNLHSEYISDENTIYKLRHFITGKVLTVKEVIQERSNYSENIFIPCLTTNNEEHLFSDSDIEFLPAGGIRKNQIESPCCIHMKVGEKFLLVTKSFNIRDIDAIKSNQQIITMYCANTDDNNEEYQKGKERRQNKTMIYEPLTESEQQIKRSYLVCDEHRATEENAFQIIKLNQQYKYDVLFVNSVLPPLQFFIYQIRLCNKLSPQLIRQVQQIINSLQSFLNLNDLMHMQNIYKKSKTKNPGSKQVGGVSGTQGKVGGGASSTGNSNNQVSSVTQMQVMKVRRQQLMKEFKIIDHLLDILYYPFELGKYYLKRIEIIEKEMQQLFRDSYSLIKKIIKDYQPNELYASQWLNLLIQHSIETPVKSDLGAQETLTELIDNNKKVLETKIQIKHIDDFTHMLEQCKESKNVRLMRALVVCNGLPMVKNQQAVTNNLIACEDRRNRLIYKILSNGSNQNRLTDLQNVDQSPQLLYGQSSNNNQIFVEIPDIGQVEIQDLCSNENYQDPLNYFLEMIYLLSELCMDRNYEAIEQVQQMVPRDVCLRVTSQQVYDIRLKDCFTRLLLSVWVDIHPYIRMQRPERIKLWTELQTYQGLIDTDKDISALENLKQDLVQTYLQLITTNIQQRFSNYSRTKTCVLSEEHGSFLKSILLLCKTMLELGFYKNIEEINCLLQIIWQLLISDYVPEDSKQIKNSKTGVVNTTNNNQSSNTGMISTQIHSSSFNSNASSYSNGGNEMGLMRYEQIESNIIMHECKEIICEILLIILDIKDNIQVSVFLSKFKEFQLKHKEPPAKRKQSIRFNQIQQLEQKSVNSSHSNNSNGRNANKRKSLANKDRDPRKKSFTLIPFLTSAPLQEKKLDTPEEWIEDILSNNSNQVFYLNFSETSNYDINCILLDLTLYKRHSLVNKSFKLLYQLFNQRQTMITLLEKILLIETETDIQVYTEFTEVARKLAEIFEKSEEWLFKESNTAAQQLADQAQDLLNFLETRIFDAKTNTQQALLNNFVDNVNNPKAPQQQQLQQEEINYNNNIEIGEEISIGKNKIPQLLINKANEEFIQKDQLENSSNKQQVRFKNMPQGISSNSGASSNDPIDYQQLVQDEEDQQLLKCNKLNQNLLVSLGIPNLIIQLLRFDVESFSKERSKLKIYQHQIDGFSMVLLQCYRVLGKIVQDNEENKNILIQYMDIFFDHLKTFPQLQLYNLFSPLFTDNRTILRDSVMVKRIVDNIFNVINQLNSLTNQTLENAQFNLSANYLESVMQLVMLKGECIRENQTIIMEAMVLQRQRNFIIFNVMEDREYKVFQQQIVNLDQQVASRVVHNEPIILPKILDYYVAFIKLIGVLSSEKNNATESKARSYFPIELIQQLIIMSGKHFYIKQNLFFLFYHIYLETEKDMSEEINSIKKSIVQLIQDEIQSIAKEMKKKLTFHTYKGIVSNKKLLRIYFFDTLLLCADFFVQQQITEDVRFLDNLITSIAYQARELGPNVTPDQERIMKSIVNNIQQNFKKSYNIQQKMYKLLPQYIRDLEIAPLANDKQRRQGQIQQQKTIGKKKKLPISSKELNSEKLKNIIGQVMKNKTFQCNKSEEIQLMVKIFVGVQQNTKLVFKGQNTIDFSQLASSLIYVLQHEHDSKLELKMIRLLVLRKMIENENQKFMWESQDIPSAEWSTEDYIACEQQILVRQNQLIDLGIANMIIQILKNQFEPKAVKQECILLCIALLLSGNINAQNSFYHEMVNDQNNEFLFSIFQLITISFQNIKKQMGRMNKVLFEKFMCEERLKEEKQKAKNKIKLQMRNDENNSDEDAKSAATDEVQETLQTMIEELENSEDQLFEAEDKKDLVLLKRVFRLLQLFCEGHNSQMQNHLRVQLRDGIPISRSLDFIFTTAIQLQYLTKFINVYCLELGHQMFDFLIESLQGPCTKNQATMCRGKIIDTCKDFLQQFESPVDFGKVGCGEQDIQELKSLQTKSTKLLYSLTEGGENRDIIQMLSNSLDVQFLLERLLDEYNDLKQRIRIKPSNNNYQDILDLCGKHFDETLMDAFNIYQLILTLADQNQEVKILIENQSKEVMQAINFFNMNTISVEIVFNRDGSKSRLVKIYFPCQPICRFMSENTKKRIMQEVPRESTNEKIEGLMDEIPQIFVEIDHLSYLSSKWYLQLFSSNRLNFLRDTSTILSFIINIQLIWVYYVDFSGDETRTAENKVLKTIPSEDIINFMGFLQIGTSSLVLVFWFIINSHQILKRSWSNLLDQNNKQLNNFSGEQLKQEIDEYCKKDPEDLTLDEATQILYYKGPDAPSFNQDGELNFQHQFLKYRYYWQNICFLLTQGAFLYMLFYIIISFMGTFIADWLYCFHLLDVVGRFDTLLNVIRAVTTNLNQLALTSMLAIILIYLWALVGFYFLDDTYRFLVVSNYEGMDIAENQCTSLLQCYIVTIGQGLIRGGGIAEVIQFQTFTPENFARFGVRWFFDVSFFLIIKMAFLNMIFGIIINTFAQLRDKKSKMDEDMKNVCFICGLDRETFDRLAEGGFEKHIKKDHHLWNYVYYIYHLVHVKEETDYDGIEAYIREKYNKQDNSWIPLLRALSLQEDSEGTDNIEQQIEQFNEILNNIAQINHKVDSLQKDLAAKNNQKQYSTN